MLSASDHPNPGLLWLMPPFRTNAAKWLPKQEQTHSKEATVSGVHSSTCSMSFAWAPDCSSNGYLAAWGVLRCFLDDTCFTVLFWCWAGGSDTLSWWRLTLSDIPGWSVSAGPKAEMPSSPSSSLRLGGAAQHSGSTAQVISTKFTQMPKNS